MEAIRFKKRWFGTLFVLSFVLAGVWQQVHIQPTLQAQSEELLRVVAIVPSAQAKDSIRFAGREPILNAEGLTPTQLKEATKAIEAGKEFNTFLSLYSGDGARPLVVEGQAKEDLKTNLRQATHADDREEGIPVKDKTQESVNTKQGSNSHLENANAVKPTDVDILAKATNSKELQLAIEEKLRGDTIEFRAGSAKLTAHGRELLVLFAKDFKRLGPGLVIRVEGHTDNTGKAKANKWLSIKRARAVKAELVALGLRAAQIETKGYGDTQPIADNGDAAGRQKNRRIHFTLSEER